MAKKKSKTGKKQNTAGSKKAEEERVTMKALEEMSDSSDDEAVPESQWSTKAKNLRQEIEDGKFDKVLGALKKAKEEANGDEEEFEEDSLGSSGDEEEAAEEDEEEKDANDEAMKNQSSEEEEEHDDDEDQESESEEEEPKNVKMAESAEAAEADGSDDDASEEDEEEESDDEDDKAQRLTKNNHNNSKALTVVTAELAASHANLPWAETFHVIPATPLPFGQLDEDNNPLDIHDDLKREVAFYNSALEAVHDARTRCKEANIQFSRPDDFFAEMIKTDDHMAKVKDRLIFETKKMDAVAQRKSNREQKLRAKESHANKLAEKSKRKRDHFQEVEEWAQAAAQNRGGALRDDADEMFLRGNKGPNKKREYANKKYGFGGKTGRFKQNDRASKSDVSGFNPRGNFSGMGMKKTAKTQSGSGAARPGKRSRDSKRARK